MTLNSEALALAPAMERFGLDATDLDMLTRGDMLGSTGAKVFAALQALSALPSGDELVDRLNDVASIIEQWDAWEIGAANKPSRRLTASPSKDLREAATRIQSLMAEVERLERALAGDDRRKRIFRRNVRMRLDAEHRSKTAEARVKVLEEALGPVRTALLASGFSPEGYMLKTILNALGRTGE